MEKHTYDPLRQVLSAMDLPLEDPLFQEILEELKGKYEPDLHLYILPLCIQEPFEQKLRSLSVTQWDGPIY